MTTPTLVLVAAALVISAVPMDAGEMTFATYANARFHYVVDVPAHFVKGKATVNNDGLTFTSPLDAGTISVAGSDNALKKTIAQVQAEKEAAYKNAGAVIEYRAGEANGFVISGTQGTTTFYEKVVFAKNRTALVTVRLRYPQSLKARYDIIVKRASRTLRFASKTPSRT